MKLSDLPIKARLALGFAAMGVLMGALGLTTLRNVVAIEHHFAEVMDDHYAKVKIANEIKAVNNEVSQALRNLFVMSEPEDVKAQYDLIAGSSKQSNGNMEKLQKGISDPAGQAALAKLSEARAAYRAPREKMIELLKAGKVEQAKTALLA